MVGRETPKVSAISCTVCSFESYIARACEILVAVILNLGPPLRPRARAAARPSWVHSTIRSCSNSAIAASMWEEASAGCRRVDSLRQCTQADPALLQFLCNLFEVTHRAAQPVQLCDDQGISVPDVLKHLVKRRPTGEDTRGVFNEDFLASGSFENVRLSFGVLGRG